MTLPRACSLLVFSLVITGCRTEMTTCCTPPSPAPVAQCSWRGIYPTVVTPWCCDRGVDEASLAAQIHFQLKHGVHGLLVLGTIGEGEYATLEERAQVIRVAVGQTQGCVPVVVGIHTCDCTVAKTQLQQAKELGASAVLVKYLGRPCASYPEVYGFYQELVAQAAQNCLPIFYYHYPRQTGLKLSPSEVAQILLIPGVVGIKESTLDLKEVEAHIALTCGRSKVFLSGTALNFEPVHGDWGARRDVSRSGAAAGPDGLLLSSDASPATRNRRGVCKRTSSPSPPSCAAASAPSEPRRSRSCRRRT